MAAATANLTLDNTSDALFRAWGSALSAQLAAFGWVYVADAGVINWAAVTRPLAANTKMGFEIYRFADALQATAPVFMRIDYGSGSNAVYPGLWFTFGTGTDGAGGMNAGALPIIQTNFGTNSLVSLACYFSGTTGRGCFCMNPGTANKVWFVSVERTKDAAGADTGDGIVFTCHLLTALTPGNWTQIYYQLGIGSQGNENRLGILMPSVGSGVTGADTAIYPQWIARGPFLPYGMNLFGYFTDDLVALNTYALTVYGAAHTYLALGPNLGGCVQGATATKSTLLMRYE